MQALITVDQLSHFLRKSVASIRSDATRNPTALPPICRIPGTKRLLWRMEDVESWLASHVTGITASQDELMAGQQPRRGRPTKAEQLAKQKRLSEGERFDMRSRTRA